jgi:hypothetical protein
MKNKIFLFTVTFVGYIIIFLLFARFQVGTKQIAEMIFIGSVSGVGTVMLDRPFKKLLANVLKKLRLTS